MWLGIALDRARWLLRGTAFWDRFVSAKAHPIPSSAKKKR